MAHPGSAPTLEIQDRIATITLRRPELANRLDDADLETFYQHLETVDQAENVMVLRLCAEGRYFCSGYKVDNFSGERKRSPITFETLTDRLEQVRPLTIAAVNGGLFGGATDLALSCDFRIGVEDCRMFVPAARLGLHFYQSGMERMVSRLGFNTAKRVLLTCEEMNGQEMLNCGFLTELVSSPEALQDRVDTLSHQLAGLAPLAVLPMKKHLNALGHGSIDREAFLADEKRASRSEDLGEGARAWREKRAPIFKGR